ncbi:MULTISPECIES: thioredoxin family protein [Shouchella]|uniref:Thioredoxin n=3 Tax=Bacillaceae TaxID=186817 RepID=A0A060LXQ9_9BACI|nr:MULTISPECIES: thioredoxin family protein [Bacillaceae]RQW20428.1 thioredoxin [Bacillus sp. C1-1]AIC94555.1 thioredoxin [Shouchella lehensis G1]KQL51882.1 hypothetical protein AN965_19185 [Alkalicoccobacillus plakortidis]MBG9784549.1 hypothetical protein [Shouchella lehensis]TES50442.1 thioredoxin [Shouchella lehensis]
MIETSIVELNKRLQQNWTGWVYVSSPFCGTCQLAEQMLHVVESLQEFTDPILKLNLQLAPEFAMSNRIESVPAMIYYKDGRKIRLSYQFKSVIDLQHHLKEVTTNVNSI